MRLFYFQRLLNKNVFRKKVTLFRFALTNKFNIKYITYLLEKYCALARSLP